MTGTARVAAEPEVQGVTDAAAPRSADRDARARVYVIQMAIRTACVITAFFVHGWWQLVFILGAVVLPYVAVVRVNNIGPHQVGERRAPVPTQPALAAEPSAPTPAADEGPVVVPGEVVDDAVPRALPTARRHGEAA